MPFKPFRVKFDPPISNGQETITDAVIYDATSMNYEEEEDA